MSDGDGAASLYGAKEFAADIDVSRETLHALTLYSDQLAKWQKAKNLVAPSTLSDLWQRHLLDSAQLAPLIMAGKEPGDAKPAILDFGSGAGFPGLVLAVMGVGPVTLVESNGRKASFMNHVIRETRAEAKVLNERIETIPPMKPDIITSRACASLGQLLDWAAPHVHENTELWFLKGQKAQQELTEAGASWIMEHEIYPSLTEPDGHILKLSHISRKSI